MPLLFVSQMPKMASGSLSGSAKYVLENCPVEDGIKYETRAGANSALVKWIFPKAIELRVQIDFSYGFPKGSKEIGRAHV